MYNNAVILSTTTYSNNVLNPMLSYTETHSVSSAYSVVNFSYDANVTHTNKAVITTENTEYTEYVYDEDGRLIVVAEGLDLGSPSHNFSYDYRSRRYYDSPAKCSVHRKSSY